VRSRDGFRHSTWTWRKSSTSARLDAPKGDFARRFHAETWWTTFLQPNCPGIISATRRRNYTVLDFLRRAQRSARWRAAQHIRVALAAYDVQAH